MRRRTCHLIFWPCLLIVFGVMAWLSYSIWVSESIRAEERYKKQEEEQTRLALWRLDSAMAALTGRENHRPAQEYFFLTNARKGEHSPLFDEHPEFARFYFQIDPMGKFLSPMCPEQEQFEQQLRLGKVSEVPQSSRENRNVLTSEPFLQSILTASGAVISDEQDKKEKSVARIPAVDGFLDMEHTQTGNLIAETISNEPPPAPVAEQARNIVPSNSVNSLNLKQAQKDFDSRMNLTQNVAVAQNSAIVGKGDPFVDEERSKVSRTKEIFAKRSDESKMGSVFGKAINKVVKEDIISVKETDVIEPSLSQKASLVYGEKIMMDGDSPSELSNPHIEEKAAQPFRDIDSKIKGKGTLSYREAIGEVKSVLWARSPEKQAEEEVMPDVSLSENSISISPFVPHWIGEELFLLRTVKANTKSYVQGIWMDWEKLQGILKAEIADILPEASFHPCTKAGEKSVNMARIMASLPVYIEPGRLLQTEAGGDMSSLALTMGIAWCCALVAACGVIALILGVVRLSERRATFVSAVTHELRTPLTTFNLYTEMLMEGLVPEQKRQTYFQTLRNEATRLTHMVDNVLSFSRIEKTKSKRHYQQVTVQELRDLIIHYITPRLREVGMDVQDTLSPEVTQLTLETDVTAVEQIFYNFADNVAKYAADAGGVVELHIWEEGRRLAIGFRDHGAGLPESVMKKLFKPFSRSAEEAAGKKPGVGLGLALSREIARDLGGDLKLDIKPHKGAAYVLYLPLKKRGE